MKKIKIVVSLVLAGFVALVIYQNQQSLMNKPDIQLSLWILGDYHYSEISNGILILAFFLTGFLIAYFLTLPYRFKTGKTTRNLNETIRGHEKTIASLKTELGKLQAAAPQPQESQPQEPRQSESSAENT